MPMATDRDETQQSEVPPEEWVHTPSMKEALSKEKTIRGQVEVYIYSRNSFVILGQFIYLERVIVQKVFHYTGWSIISPKSIYCRYIFIYYFPPLSGGAC